MHPFQEPSHTNPNECPRSQIRRIQRSLDSSPRAPGSRHLVPVSTRSHLLPHTSISLLLQIYDIDSGSGNKRSMRLTVQGISFPGSHGQLQGPGKLTVQGLHAEIQALSVSSNGPCCSQRVLVVSVLFSTRPLGDPAAATLAPPHMASLKDTPPRISEFCALDSTSSASVQRMHTSSASTIASTLYKAASCVSP